MYSVRSVATMLALALAQGALAQNNRRPQPPSPSSQRAARALALRDSLAALDVAARRLSVANARRGISGPVLVVLRSSDDQATADQVAVRIREAVQQFGVFADSELAAIAVVDDAVSSSGDIIAGPSGPRRVVAFPRPGGTEQAGWLGRNRAEILADNAIWTVSEGFLHDSLVRDWLERRLDPRTDSDANAGVVEDLAIGTWSATRGCMTARSIECVRYLGLEDAPDLRARFPVNELRDQMVRQHADELSSNNIMFQCSQGQDHACLTIARGYVVPASLGARRSFVVFIKSRYGVPAARILLDGPEPTLGARVRRATQEDPAVVAARWRDWVLVTGRRQAVQAGLRWILSATVAAGLLLALATRSGRWAR